LSEKQLKTGLFQTGQNRYIPIFLFLICFLKTDAFYFLKYTKKALYLLFF
jgi:hypothetical protein